jgi:hypothetical protein
MPIGDDRVDQSLGQRHFGCDLGKAPGLQRDQRLAQVLARVHLGLAPGLRWRVGEGLGVLGPAAVVRTAAPDERRSVGRRHGWRGQGGANQGRNGERLL